MIQKLPNQAWLDEIGRIYGAYEIYHLSDGAEQPVFTSTGVPSARSKVLTCFVAELFKRHGDAAQLLDIGCGNGAALANFSTALPGWSFDGNELLDKSLEVLQQIPGFRKLHIGSTEKVTERYDVVSMIHSLEHMPVPDQALREAVRLMQADGTLFIEVPDLETSHFDLLVADHLTHFTRTTLSAFAARHGVAVDILKNGVLPKEITLVGHCGAVVPGIADIEAARGLARRTVGWLHAVLDAATAASAAPTFGLFGSSVSGMWLYGALRDRVAFFVDEDKARVAHEFDGTPVLTPEQIPEGATVFVPLVHSVAVPLVQRLAGIKANFILPPAFAA
jgi:ubiquinone/menaquinone biosynthesis C-methylase UbiE